ncbi:hypothetical protein F4808DRAFT_262938 [Astrocystis sublimbata]|nr:hypothetical protein F4808DRAFT_262938 [Astrocystis sublimbata]
MSARKIASYNDETTHSRDDDAAAALTRTLSHNAAARVSRSDTPIYPSTLKQAPAAAERPASPNSERRNVVIPDPVAFRYLEEDKSVRVVERKAELKGYELYLVEQWACSRQTPTLVIVTYTGDANHGVVIGVLSVPADEKAWSPRLRIYFKAIHQYHARPRDTELGELMVTNLSSFPSALTVMSVPGGNIKNQRRTFIVNENLKRLGCSGRSGIALSEPIPAAKAKFSQLYKTSIKVSTEEAVIELVKFCQVALYLFGKLDQVYIDGLLCDVTETSVGDWWTEFGVEYFNVEPTDGILGPTTVAAVLGLLAGARNRLSYWGAPVPKDVFDIDTMERGISHFQKYHKIERTRKLNRQTMRKLHTLTAKAAAGEGWGVQKAVKSTVTDIGGKRGEMVLGMVGSRDKGAIGDIETIDLDRFVGLVSGERAKWLWHGKAKRTPMLEHEKSGPDIVLLGKDGKEDLRASFEEDPSQRQKEDSSPAVYAATPVPGSSASMIAADSPGDKDALRRGVFKSVARDARSGLGRIKDAMTSGTGLRGHAGRPSRDESAEFPFGGSQNSFLSGSTSAGFVNTPGPITGSAQLGRAFTWKNKPEEYANATRKDKDSSGSTAAATPGPGSGSGSNNIATAIPLNDNETPTGTGESRVPARINEAIQRLASNDKRHLSQIQHHVQDNPTTAGTSVAGSVAGERTMSEVENEDVLAAVAYRSSPVFSSLRRRHSLAGCQPDLSNRQMAEARWARRLSFGDAEEAVLTWEEIVGVGVGSLSTEFLDGVEGDANTFPNAKTGQGQGQQLSTSTTRSHTPIEVAQAMYLSINNISKTLSPWAKSHVRALEASSKTYARQASSLQTTYADSSTLFSRAQHDHEEILADYRENLTESLGRIEGEAAKLEYEITALLGRVQEVEDSAAQYEIQVEEVEMRADELKAQLEMEGWLHWIVRRCTGVGTGANITRGRGE